MKVNVKIGKPDVFVGDIINFNKKPCMVVHLGGSPDKYGVVSLDGVEGGCLLATFGGLYDIDVDSRTESVLINWHEVVISKKRGAE